MRDSRVWIAAAVIASLSVAAGASDGDWRRLMVEGKLRADLGDHDQASAAFRAVAEDGTAPSSLRGEALVRLGLSRSAAGDTSGSAAAFRAAAARRPDDPGMKRFLIRAVARAVPGKIWPDFRGEIEDLLRHGRVVATEELGPGLLPRKVTLERGETELAGIWRPASGAEIRDGSRLEVAAYELDKLLDLDMVPPTVPRALNGREGTLQLWVFGCQILEPGSERVPGPSTWEKQVWRMRTLDQLIGNRDRNLGNILVDPDGKLVLVDHGQAFGKAPTPGELPQRFDRRLLEKLRQLRAPDLNARLEGVLTRSQVDGLLKRRDLLVAHAARLVEERGEQAVLF